MTNPPTFFVKKWTFHSRFMTIPPYIVGNWKFYFFFDLWRPPPPYVFRRKWKFHFFQFTINSPYVLGKNEVLIFFEKWKMNFFDLWRPLYVFGKKWKINFFRFTIFAKKSKFHWFRFMRPRLTFLQQMKNSLFPIYDDHPTITFFAKNEKCIFFDLRRLSLPLPFSQRMKK